eukprot:TRINITY_DN71230_c0_g1_i1.p1 TRINITY_DN71230_c0_g1~~TRINITY_DN71230_c0_g1_i1.p1  ORF type:complete len:276 (-),score=47.95 TRINITY_DN71230_c0_g1_i1:236-1063(-)
MAKDPQSPPIDEYAFELVPDEASQMTMLKLFGISPDSRTRLGWERKFEVKHFRDGLIDAWPAYLHASLLFVTPPPEIVSAGDLRALVRDNRIQAAMMQGLPEPLELQFCGKPFETPRGASLLIPDDNGSAVAFNKLDSLRHHLKEVVCQEGLGKVRDECQSQRLHLTVRGVWIQGGARAHENLEQHMLQWGAVSKPFTLRFDRVTVTPWPKDRRDKRDQFHSGWAAWWRLGQEDHAHGKGKKGNGKGKKGKDALAGYGQGKATGKGHGKDAKGCQ